MRRAKITHHDPKDRHAPPQSQIVGYGPNGEEVSLQYEDPELERRYAEADRITERARKTMDNIIAFQRHMHLTFFSIWLLGVFTGAVLMQVVLQ